MIYGNISYATLTGGGTGGNAYEVRFGYQVLSEDIPNNRRQVRLQLEVRSVKSAYGTYGFTQTSTIDGSTLSSASFDMRNTNVWQVFGSRTITINGAYSGTKTGSFTTSATTSSGNYTLKSGSAGVYINLPTLHQPPVITGINVLEQNSNLTGVSNETFVANLSNKRFTVSYTTSDSATLLLVQVYQNNSLIGSSSSATVDINYANVNMYYSQSGTSYVTPIVVKITDSMGGSTMSTVTNYTVIPYIVPNVVTTGSSVKRNGQTTGKAILNLVANSYQGNIGSISNNLSLSFAYWVKEDSESTTYYPIPSSAYSISGNTITINGWNIAINGTEITDLLKENTYYFKVKIEDSFNTSYGLLICSKGEWIMAKFKDRVDFKKITIGGDNPLEYSSNETICGVWKNGKNVYRKVITTTSPSSGSETALISTPQVEDYVDMKATIINVVDAHIQFPYFFGTSNYGNIWYDERNKSISCQTTHQAYQNKTIEIIFKYTKIND